MSNGTNSTNSTNSTSSTKDTSGNNGPFYRSDELVTALQNTKVFGGVHPGYRPVHAYGRFYLGTFTATEQASTVSRASHFNGTPVPVTARLSGGSGDPDAPETNVFAIATKFYLGDGTVTDMIGITLPAFVVRTPDEAMGLFAALTPDPVTGEKDEEKAHAFLAAHPATARVFSMAGEQPAPLSLARTSFRPLHAFRFVNADGVGRWARYHWEPVLGTAFQEVSELQSHPVHYIYDEFESRLSLHPVSYRLELEFAEEGDPVDDPSAFWPEGRERFVAGHLELTRPATHEELPDPVMMHDPTRVTDGIEINADDQIIAARRGVYLFSVAERTGGWQGASPALAGVCPMRALSDH
jgi:catalase